MKFSIKNLNRWRFRQGKEGHIKKFNNSNYSKFDNFKLILSSNDGKWYKTLVIFTIITYGTVVIVNDMAVKYDRSAYRALVAGPSVWQEYQNEANRGQINLKNLKFYKKHFQGYKFTNVDFSGMQCFGCIFEDTQFYEVKFDGSYLQAINFKNVTIEKSDLVDVFGVGISVEKSKILNTVFKRNYLMQGDFSSNNLENVLFIDSNLYELYFIQNVFRGVDFINGTKGELIENTKVG